MKVKRRHCDWYSKLLEIGDLKMSEDFWLMKSKHPLMSNNRIAYNVLKRYYSTTTLTAMRYDLL